MSATAHKPNFLNLPIEIRWMIYQHALLHTRVAVGWNGTWDFGRRELERTPYALLRTCKRVYADIVDEWPQWCLLDLGPLQRYNSVKMLDVISRIPMPIMQNLQTLCVSAFHVVVFRPSPQADQVYNGFSFFSFFRSLNLKRLLLRWDDTISSPSSPASHDYQYAVIREQLVQYGTGWRELYLATPFEAVAAGLDYEIKKRDGIDSGACAIHLGSDDEQERAHDDPGAQSTYDALTNSSPKGRAYIIAVKRGQNVDIHQPPLSTPVINDPHTQIQWFRGTDTWADCSSYPALRQSFVP